MVTTRKEPLYRKENRTAHKMRHPSSGDFADIRNTKRIQEQEGTRLPMNAKYRLGRDYTPLFRFLLSKVGQPWAQVHSEAVSRLDTPEPIFWLVALKEEDKRDSIRAGESSYYSGLFVDEEGILRIVDPELNAATMTPYCPCCTHTFNGKPFGGKWKSPYGVE